jgi:peptidoglycan/LPS O-acetylase OafA/YrhL
MMAIIIYWQIAPFLLSGPIWSSFNALASSCNNGGIVWNMFFIDNFGNHGPSGMDYCFGWGWYLAVDFQFFLITPLIFFVYNKNKTIGFLLTFLIWLGSIITAFAMIMVNDWRYPIPNPIFPPQPEFMDKFYYKPYIRVSAYMMGIWVGMFYLEWKH